MVITNRVCNKKKVCLLKNIILTLDHFLVLLLKLFKLKVLAIMTLSEATLICVLQGLPNYPFPQS